MDFRRGVLKGVVGSSHVDPRRIDRESALDIAIALAGVRPVEGIYLDAAVRCILFDLWSGIPAIDYEIEELLGSSWSGNVLRTMQQHYAVRQAAQRTAEEYVESAQKRKEEKRQAKREQHAIRLGLKRERDRIWRQAHQGEPEDANILGKKTS